MDLAEGIRKIGFRRWYERQLIETHFYLVSCILCLILVLACLEGFSFRAPGWDPLLRLGAMFGGGAACVWSLTRYFAALGFAEHVARRSVCAKCAAYGLLDVISVREMAHPASLGGHAGLGSAAVGVRCRQCGNEWTIK